MAGSASMNAEKCDESPGYACLGLYTRLSAWLARSNAVKIPQSRNPGKQRAVIFVSSLLRGSCPRLRCACPPISGTIDCTSQRFSDLLHNV